MDCSSVCLLALSLALPQPHNVQKCSYCMDIRLLDEQCFDDLSSCMSDTPDSILYCLTIHEVSWTSQVNRLVRCLSHSDFSLTQQNAEKLLNEGSCSRRAMLSCDCPTCMSPRIAQTPEPKPQADAAAQQSTTVRTTETSSMSMEFKPEMPRELETEEENEEPTENQVTEKPEMRTARTGHSSTVAHFSISFLFCLLLWYLCQ